MGGGGEFSRRRPDGSGGKGDLSSIPRTHTEGKNYFKSLSSDPHAHKLIIHKDKGEKTPKVPSPSKHSEPLHTGQSTRNEAERKTHKPYHTQTANGQERPKGGNGMEDRGLTVPMGESATSPHHADIPLLTGQATQLFSLHSWKVTFHGPAVTSTLGGWLTFHFLKDCNFCQVRCGGTHPSTQYSGPEAEDLCELRPAWSTSQVPVKAT